MQRAVPTPSGAGWTWSKYDGTETRCCGAHVLVTGGTSGIGAASAALFRDAGATVTITGTRGGAAEYDADLAGYRYFQLDIEDTGQIDAVAASLPRLDALVNNAGIAPPSLGLDEWKPDVFDRAVAMLLNAAWRAARSTCWRKATCPAVDR